MLVFSSSAAALVKIENDLAGLIDSNASVSDVLDYIETTGAGEFGHMLKYAMHLSRVYSLDFAARCGDAEFGRLLASAAVYGTRLLPYFRWQIYGARSRRFDRFRYNFKNELDSFATAYQIQHPYRHAFCSMSDYDSKFTSASLEDFSSAYRYINSVFAQHANSSIFIDRIIQPDCLKSIDSVFCTDMILNICRHAELDRLAVFMRSLFTRPDITSVEKMFCINAVRLRSKPNTKFKIFDNTDSKRFASAEPDDSSFAEFTLDLNISGFDCENPFEMILDAILYRKQWFDEWCHECPEEIDSILKCSDLAA